MAKLRRGSHSTLTETADIVVSVLEQLPGIKLIAPGEIRTGGRRRAGGRHLTIVHTAAGLELIITGQSVQRVAVHATDITSVITTLKHHKKLTAFTVSERERKPGS